MPNIVSSESISKKKRRNKCFILKSNKKCSHYNILYGYHVPTAFLDPDYLKY